MHIIHNNNKTMIFKMKNRNQKILTHIGSEKIKEKNQKVLHIYENHIFDLCFLRKWKRDANAFLFPIVIVIVGI